MSVSRSFVALMGELRRRRVLRVLAGYAAGAFVLLQVADLVVEPLHLPSWTMALLIVLVLAGFVLAAILAWSFQLGPDGIERAAPLAASPAAGDARRVAWIGLGIVIGLVVVGSAGFIATQTTSSLRGSDDEIGSIAVLPFENLSADPEQEYFGEGLAEELLDALGRIERLRVPARTSSFAFKGQQLDVRDIGRRLGVEVVLEGSVRKSGNTLRVSAKLVDVASGYTIFSETYDRSADDVFAVQTELSRAILAAIRLNPDDDGAAAVVRAGTTDARAHDAYLAGLYHFHQRGRSVDSAIADFEAALGADPEYADAWAGLASAYAVVPFHSTLPVDSAGAAGRFAARRALELDPRNAQAHAALGQIAATYDWDFTAATGHYRRALAIEPNNANTHLWLAESMYKLGRLDDAFAEVSIARDADPLSPVVAQLGGSLLYAMGRTDEAVRELERSRRLNPDLATTRNLGGLILARLGRCEEAIAFVADGLSGEAIQALAAFYGGVCDPAQRPQARAIADAFAAQVAVPGSGIPAVMAAILYDMIGETDLAQRWFVRAYRERDPILPDVVTNYTSPALRARPAVRAIIEEIGMAWVLERSTDG